MKAYLFHLGIACAVAIAGFVALIVLASLLPAHARPLGAYPQGRDCRSANHHTRDLPTNRPESAA